MPLLRTHRLFALLLVMVPFAAPVQAAPASKKPKVAPSSSEGPKPVAKAGLKPVAKPPAKHFENASHGSTAHLTPVSGQHRVAPGTSIGSPTEGHLVGGAHLADAPYLRIYPSYSGGDVRWGLEPLVGLVDRAGKAVHKQFPDAVLSVGHLSKAGGGELDRHASHESGRDADVGFYVKNTAGKPIYGDHMVAFIGDGTAPKWPGAHFDDARNWALVAAMVGDGRARVTHLFVATPIRERLLAYAAKIGAPPGLRSRAAEVLAQPHGALPHDDHFHVRIACPSGMDKCVEQPTARAHRKGHAGALASHGHPAHSSHGAHAASGHAHAATGQAAGASAAHGAHAAHASAPAPAHGASHPAAAPTKPASKPEPAKEADARTESMPSLGPVVPGLDSAVIPAPLTGVRSTWGVSKDPPPPAPAAPAAPKEEPISDPDGVL